MTKDKGVKRVVRRRMEKTGESYAAARAQLVAEGPRAGKCAETAALAWALERAGATNPATGRPFSEEMLFGLGGGIGAAYWLMEWKMPTGAFVTLYVGGIINPFVQKQEFLDAAVARAGARLTVKTATTPRAAEKQLREALAGGPPVILTVDAALCPGADVPRELAGTTPRSILVELRGDRPALIGLGRVDEVAWDELAAMRGRVRSAKNRLVAVAAGPGGADLAGALREAIGVTVRGLEKPGMTNFGLPALARWAEALTAKNKKGWPQIFAGARKLAWPLRFMATQIERGTGGGNYRRLYAGFLDEASAVLGRPALKEVAARYRALAVEWTALAALAPRAAPEKPFTSEPPIPPGELAELLGAMHAKVAGLHRGEEEAARALAAAI